MQRRRLNTRFALYFLCSLVVLCVSTYFVHAYQVQHNASALLDRAAQATKDGELERAAGYYRRYLGFVPTDTDALARLGLLMSEPALAKSKRDVFQAMRVMQRVLLRDPARNDVRRRLARISIEGGVFVNAKKDLEEHLIPAFPNDGELAFLLAQCHEHAATLMAARVEYERAIRTSPQLLEPYQRLASLLRRPSTDVVRKDERPAEMTAKADAVMDAMVTSNPQSFRAFLVHAEDRRLNWPNDPRTAEIVARDIAQARSIQPDAADVLLAAASDSLNRKMPDEGRAILTRGCQVHEKDYRFYLALARLENSAGDADAALSALRDGLTKLPSERELLWSTTDLLVVAGRKDDALKSLGRLEAANVAKVDIDCFRARIFANEQQWAKAITLLDDVVPRLNSRSSQNRDSFTDRQAEQACLLLGRCCEQLGDFDRALTVYSRLIARDSRSVSGRLGLAGALATLGRHVEALEQYRQLERLPNAPLGVQIEIARLLFLRTIEREPSKRDWSEVSSALKRIEQLTPLPKQAVVYRAEMFAAEGKFDEARDFINAKYPDRKSRPIEAWIALSNAESRRGDHEAALAILNDAREFNSQSVELAVARAQSLALKPRDQAIKGISAIADEATTMASKDQRHLLHECATLAMRNGDPHLARTLWKRVAIENPDDVRYQIGLFDAAVQLGDFAATEEVIGNLRRIEKEDGVLWRYARASMLINKAANGDKSGLAEARSLLAVVAARRSTWSRVAVSQARLDDLEGGRNEAALAGYLRALNSGDSDPLVLRRAVELLSKDRRYAEANELMKRQPGQTQLPQDLQRIGAQVALFSKDSPNAVRLAEAAIERGSQDFRDHLFLGRVYLSARKFEEAGREFEKARELANGEPEARIALVQFLASTGKKERAMAEVESAKSQLTGPAAGLALAHCYEAVNLVDQAKTEYATAVKSQPSDVATIRGAASFYFRTGQYSDAELLLRRLTTEFKKESPAAARWARDRLAVLLSMRGDPQRAGEALALLVDDEPSTSASDHAATQRTRAIVLAMQNSNQSRREAVKIIESIIEKRVAEPNDYFIAAQLHESLNDWPRARFRYLGFLDLPGADTPVHIFVVARSLLRHGDAETSRKYVDQFVSAVGDTSSLQVAELKARLLHADGKTSEGIAVLRSYSGGDKANLLAAAQILTEINEHAAAEELHRKNAERSGRPIEMLALAQYLTSRGKAVEAIDICDRVWLEAPTMAVAEVALAALATVPQDSRAFDRIENRLKESLSKTPDQPGLLAAQAAIRNFQGRFDEAEQLYRRALSKDPRLEVALNNLAWLLSLRGGGATEAIELLRQAALVVGTNPGLLDTRGVAYLSLKQGKSIDLAIEDLKAATAEAPSAGTYFHLAQAYHAAGKRKDADIAWRHAKRMGLTAEVLHPLERTAYEQLARELK